MGRPRPAVKVYQVHRDGPWPAVSNESGQAKAELIRAQMVSTLATSGRALPLPSCPKPGHRMPYDERDRSSLAVHGRAPFVVSQDL